MFYYRQRQCKDDIVDLFSKDSFAYKCGVCGTDAQPGARRELSFGGCRRCKVPFHLNQCRAYGALVVCANCVGWG